VSKVAHGDGVLLLDVRQEWALVVDLEIEDSVLVGQLEGGDINSGIVSGSGCLEGQTVEGGQHREFELDSVAVRGDKWYPVVPRVLGEFNFVRLTELATRICHICNILTTSFFTR
jgi:hypothetical protein